MSKKLEKDYDASDMEVLFHRGDWKNWQDCLNWLRKNGEKDNELTPGEVAHLIADIEQLEKGKVGFTNDYKKAYDLAKKHRNPQAVTRLVEDFSKRFGP